MTEREEPMTPETAFTTETWVTSRRSVARMDWGRQRRPECYALQVESTPTGRKVRIFMEPNEDTGAAWQGLTLQLPDGSTVEVRGSDFYIVDVRLPDGTLRGWITTDPDQPR